MISDLTALWRLRHLLLVTLLLAGCASAPRVAMPTSQPEPAHTTAPSATGAQALPPAKPEQIPKQFGGYYLDDGPIMAVPYDLDALPEPVPKAEPLNPHANKPYNVMGQSFTPLAPNAPYVAEGIASWYGRKFNGKNTSSGEPYDMFKLTAAHPTLPIPSYARVTNLENGKSVIVRINDRGPFKKNRVMDMSYAAAYRLGYNNKGSARVRVEALAPGSELAQAKPAPAPSPVPAAPALPAPAPAPIVPEPALASAAPAADPILLAANGDAKMTSPPATLTASAMSEVKEGDLWLQVAAFSSQTAADNLRAKLADGWDSQLAQPTVMPGGKLWRVRIGPFASQEDANQAVARLSSNFAMKAVVVH